MPEHSRRRLTDADVFEKAEKYYTGISGADKNSKLYRQEIKTITDIVGDLMKKPARIRNLFSGDTEVLTK